MGSDDALRDRLDGELRLVEQAILLVASRAAPRVTVAGLRLGDAILDAARRLAEEAGVRVVPLWAPDDGRTDIRVEADRRTDIRVEADRR
jgi:hypothetical protein